MFTTIEATFDGQVFRPSGPVPLEPNTTVRLTIEEAGKPVVDDYPEADFYEPVDYNWMDIAYEVDQTLERMSEVLKSHRPWYTS